MYCIFRSSRLFPFFQCSSRLSPVPRPMRITNGLVFENQAVLADRTVRPLAHLEHESSRFQFHKGRMKVRQLSQERALYVVGLSDVDPLASVRNSINP